MTFILIIITIALITIAGTTILNVLIFPRLRSSATSTDTFVSILIPARNEEAVIETTIRGILQQSYTNFELLVLDDSSTDRTHHLAQTAANGDSRVKILNGKPLPEGWSGKNWACHQLDQHASADLLLFTDADVRWQPEALQAALAQFHAHRADLLTVWPTQITETLAERLIVPLMGFVIMGYLPLPFVHHTRIAAFAAANGQCMLWNRNAYWKIGGHAAIQADVLDDVNLARRAKASGYALRMADANGHLLTRMYTNWSSVRAGYAKNILAGYGNSVPALLLAAIFHWSLFLLPWLTISMPDYQSWSILLLMLGIGSRMLSAHFTHQRIVDALLMPVSVIMMTIISIQSIYWHFTGGPRWKGRVLSNHSLQESSSWQKNQSSSSEQA